MLLSVNPALNNATNAFRRATGVAIAGDIVTGGWHVLISNRVFESDVSIDPLGNNAGKPTLASSTNCWSFFLNTLSVRGVSF